MPTINESQCFQYHDSFALLFEWEGLMMMNDPDQLVELTIFEHEFIARLLAERLEENDIHSEVFALAGEQLGLLSATTAPHNGAQIRVRAADYDRAIAVLQEFNAESRDDAETETGEED